MKKEVVQDATQEAPQVSAQETIQKNSTPNKPKALVAHNYVRQASVDPGYCRYLFVDSADHRADRVIMGSLIPVRFLPLDAEDTRNRTLTTENQETPPFALRLCSFEERYESWFLCCMADLEWMLKVEGPYLEACEELLGAPAVIRAAKTQLTEQRLAG